MVGVQEHGVCVCGWRWRFMDPFGRGCSEGRDPVDASARGDVEAWILLDAGAREAGVPEGAAARGHVEAWFLLDFGPREAGARRARLLVVMVSHGSGWTLVLDRQGYRGRSWSW